MAFPLTFSGPEWTTWAQPGCKGTWEMCAQAEQSELGLVVPYHLSLPQGRMILLRISFRSRRYHMFTQIFFINILHALSFACFICIISFKPHCWGDYFPQATSFLFVSNFKTFYFVSRYSWLTVPLWWFHDDSKGAQPYIYMYPFPQTHLPSRLPHHLECPRWLLKY